MIAARARLRLRREDVDGLVVGHVVGQAVPEDFEPAVTEGSQRLVVALATAALGVVELPGPGGAAQAGERPLVHRVGQVAVAGEPWATTRSRLPERRVRVVAPGVAFAVSSAW